MKELLKQIIFEQQEYCKNIAQDTVPREIEEEWLATTEILIVTGIRRCGKSVMLQQMRDKLPERDFFFNFDDERLVNFAVSDFHTLQECFFELFGEQHIYYFDEIQNVEGWETFVRRLYNEGNKVIVTGSNARMLSRELGTHLTGRYITVEIFPFSFRLTRYSPWQALPISHLHRFEEKACRCAFTRHAVCPYRHRKQARRQKY